MSRRAYTVKINRPRRVVWVREQTYLTPEGRPGRSEVSLTEEQFNEESVQAALQRNHLVVTRHPTPLVSDEEPSEPDVESSGDGATDEDSPESLGEGSVEPPPEPESSPPAPPEPSPEPAPSPSPEDPDGDSTDLVKEGLDSLDAAEEDLSALTEADLADVSRVWAIAQLQEIGYRSCQAVARSRDLASGGTHEEIIDRIVEDQRARLGADATLDTAVDVDLGGP